MDYTVTATPEDETTMAVLLGLGIGFIVVVLAIAILWYVFQALGFYKLSKNRGISYAWIAWIPVCQNYLLGDLIGNEVWGFGYANWILTLGTIIAGIISNYTSYLTGFWSLLALVFLIAMMAYHLTAWYKLFKMYTTKPVLFTIISLIPLVGPIVIFCIRNNKPNITID